MSAIVQLDDTRLDDEFEARGWSDGLPVVAPTRARVDAAQHFTGGNVEADVVDRRQRATARRKFDAQILDL